MCLARCLVPTPNASMSEPMLSTFSLSDIYGGGGHGGLVWTPNPGSMLVF